MEVGNLRLNFWISSRLEILPTKIVALIITNPFNWKYKLFIDFLSRRRKWKIERVGFEQRQQQQHPNWRFLPFSCRGKCRHLVRWMWTHCVSVHQAPYVIKCVPLQTVRLYVGCSRLKGSQHSIYSSTGTIQEKRTSDKNVSWQ